MEGSSLEPWLTRCSGHEGSGEKGTRGRTHVDTRSGTHTPRMQSMPLEAERVHSWPGRSRSEAGTRGPP